MIISEKLGDKVDGLLRNQVLVLSRDKLLPGLLGVTAQDAVKVRVELQVVRV